ncbi:MAG: tetratricopeptide repeat protein [Duncaniella sp.]|nr:tetratricopeptide repeat protein [Duncaniella sp.]
MKRHSLLIASLCTAALIFGASPYMDLVEESDKACGECKWEEALRAIDSAIEWEPDNPGNILLLSNKGMIQYNLGLDSLAVATLTEAHKKAPKSVTILSNRARVLTACGRDREAIADYETIMGLDSVNSEARFHHGLLSLRHRDYNSAKADFDWLLANKPDTPESNIAQATMLCALGQYAEAIPYYNHILDEIKEPEYYGARAYCHLMTGELQEASDDIAAALEKSPADGELYLYRAALNKMRYRPDDSRKDALRAIELGIEPSRAQQFLK